MAINAPTNTLYRKKYFTDKRNILTSGYVSRKNVAKPTSPVFDAATVRMAAQPVVVHSNAQSQIRVDTVRDGSKITEIRIACPCGRTAEMKVQYEG